MWDQRFESPFLQRRVQCEPGFVARTDLPLRRPPVALRPDQCAPSFQTSSAAHNQAPLSIVPAARGLLRSTPRISASMCSVSGDDLDIGVCCGDDAICFLRPIFGCLAGQAAEARIIRDAFSPIMIDGALVLPEVRLGMIDASATRRPSMPRTRNWSSTTAIGSEPILQVPTG